MKKNSEQLPPNHCAFLRGVNVKGTAMKMAEACTVFEKAGLTSVTSVLASGNILFYGEHPPDGLKERLQEILSQYFAYEAFLFVKDKQQIATIVDSNPFETNPEFHIYGFVGIDGIEKTLMQEFDQAKKAEGEEALIADANFYWRVPKGNTLGSEFGKILGRKKLKEAFTSRNMNTFEKVLRKM